MLAAGIAHELNGALLSIPSNFEDVFVKHPSADPVASFMDAAQLMSRGDGAKDVVPVIIFVDDAEKLLCAKKAPLPFAAFKTALRGLQLRIPVVCIVAMCVVPSVVAALRL